MHKADIDYYHRSMEIDSSDLADPSITRRVLTIMHCQDY